MIYFFFRTAINRSSISQSVSAPTKVFRSEFLRTFRSSRNTTRFLRHLPSTRSLANGCNTFWIFPILFSDTDKFCNAVFLILKCPPVCGCEFPLLPQKYRVLTHLQLSRDGLAKVWGFSWSWLFVSWSCGSDLQNFTLRMSCSFRVEAVLCCLSLLFGLIKSREDLKLRISLS